MKNYSRKKAYENVDPILVTQKRRLNKSKENHESEYNGINEVHNNGKFTHVT